MWVVDFLVVSFCIALSVERSKECLFMVWGVRVQLHHEEAEKRVAKEIRPALLLGEGRTAQNCNVQHRDFDATRGYPGEDI